MQIGKTFWPAYQLISKKLNFLFRPKIRKYSFSNTAPVRGPVAQGWAFTALVWSSTARMWIFTALMWIFTALMWTSTAHMWACTALVWDSTAPVWDFTAPVLISKCSNKSLNSYMVSLRGSSVSLYGSRVALGPWFMAPSWRSLRSLMRLHCWRVLYGFGQDLCAVGVSLHSLVWASVALSWAFVAPWYFQRLQCKMAVLQFETTWGCPRPVFIFGLF